MAFQNNGFPNQWVLTGENGRMTLSQRPILQQATLPVRTLNVASLVRSSNGALVLQPTTSAVQPQGIALSTLQQPIAIAQNPVNSSPLMASQFSSNSVAYTLLRSHPWTPAPNVISVNNTNPNQLMFEQNSRNTMANQQTITVITVQINEVHVISSQLSILTTTQQSRPDEPGILAVSAESNLMHEGPSRIRTGRSFSEPSNPTRLALCMENENNSEELEVHSNQIVGRTVNTNNEMQEIGQTSSQVTPEAQHQPVRQIQQLQNQINRPVSAYTANQQQVTHHQLTYQQQIRIASNPQVQIFPLVSQQQQLQIVEDTQGSQLQIVQLQQQLNLVKQADQPSHQPPSQGVQIGREDQNGQLVNHQRSVPNPHLGPNIQLLRRPQLFQNQGSMQNSQTIQKCHLMQIPQIFQNTNQAKNLQLVHDPPIVKNSQLTQNSPIVKNQQAMQVPQLMQGPSLVQNSQQLVQNPPMVQNKQVVLAPKLVQRSTLVQNPPKTQKVLAAKVPQSVQKQGLDQNYPTDKNLLSVQVRQNVKKPSFEQNQSKLQNILAVEQKHGLVQNPPKDQNIVAVQVPQSEKKHSLAQDPPMVQNHQAALIPQSVQKQSLVQSPPKAQSKLEIKVQQLVQKHSLSQNVPKAQNQQALLVSQSEQKHCLAQNQPKAQNLLKVQVPHSIQKPGLSQNPQEAQNLLAVQVPQSLQKPNFAQNPPMVQNRQAALVPQSVQKHSLVQSPPKAQSILGIKVQQLVQKYSFQQNQLKEQNQQAVQVSQSEQKHSLAQNQPKAQNLLKVQVSHSVRKPGLSQNPQEAQNLLAVQVPPSLQKQSLAQNPSMVQNRQAALVPQSVQKHSLAQDPPMIQNQQAALVPQSVQKQSLVQSPPKAQSILGIKVQQLVQKYSLSQNVPKAQNQQAALVPHSEKKHSLVQNPQKVQNLLSAKVPQSVQKTSLVQIPQMVPHRQADQVPQLIQKQGLVHDPPIVQNTRPAQIPQLVHNLNLIQNPPKVQNNLEISPIVQDPQFVNTSQLVQNPFHLQLLKKLQPLEQYNVLPSLRPMPLCHEQSSLEDSFGKFCSKPSTSKGFSNFSKQTPETSIASNEELYDRGKNFYCEEHGDVNDGLGIPKDFARANVDDQGTSAIPEANLENFIAAEEKLRRSDPIFSKTCDEETERLHLKQKVSQPETTKDQTEEKTFQVSGQQNTLDDFWYGNSRPLEHEKSIQMEEIGFSTEQNLVPMAQKKGPDSPLKDLRSDDFIQVEGQQKALLTSSTQVWKDDAKGRIADESFLLGDSRVSTAQYLQYVESLLPHQILEDRQPNKITAETEANQERQFSEESSLKTISEESLQQWWDDQGLGNLSHGVDQIDNISFTYDQEFLRDLEALDEQNSEELSANDQGSESVHYQAQGSVLPQQQDNYFLNQGTYLPPSSSVTPAAAAAACFELGEYFAGNHQATAVEMDQLDDRNLTTTTDNATHYFDNMASTFDHWMNNVDTPRDGLKNIGGTNQNQWFNEDPVWGFTDSFMDPLPPLTTSLDRQDINKSDNTDRKRKATVSEALGAPPRAKYQKQTKPKKTRRSSRLKQNNSKPKSDEMALSGLEAQNEPQESEPATSGT